MTSRKVDKESSYVTLLKQYLDLNGSWHNFETVVTEVIESNKEKFPHVEKSFWNELNIELQQSGRKELLEILLPVYQKHFSSIDLKMFIKFYRSPAGRKLAAHTPALTQENTLAGEEWSRRVGQRIKDRIKTKSN